jgi:hypothetical protein
MPRRRKPPSPTWRSFLENHLKDRVALDFFAHRHLRRLVRCARAAPAAFARWRRTGPAGRAAPAGGGERERFARAVELAVGKPEDVAGEEAAHRRVVDHEVVASVPGGVEEGERPVPQVEGESVGRLD